MKKPFLFLLSLTLALLSVACGEGDLSSIALDINIPRIISVIPGHLSLTVVFEAQNNEDGFSGYNVYFSDDETLVKSKTLLSPTFGIPSVSAAQSESTSEYRVTITSEQSFFRYATNLDAQAYETVYLENGTLYFFFIAAYNGRQNRESAYSVYYRASGSPRFALHNFSFPVSVTNSFVDRTISGDNFFLTYDSVNQKMFLEPLNGGSVMCLGAATALSDIYEAPHEGYFSFPVELRSNLLYAFKTASTNYAKVLIREIRPDAIIADSAYQPGAEIRSY